MAYDIFSQPQGPNIDINLFANNANAGIQGGKALGTPLSNALEGAVEGYKTGVAIRATEAQTAQTQAQTELTRATIDNLPQENALRELQIENERKRIELESLKIENAKATSSLSLEAEKARLEEDISQNKSELALRNKTAEFNKQFNESGIEEQKRLLMNGQFGDVFAKDEKLYQQSIQRLTSQLGDDDPDKKDLEGLLGKSKASTFGQLQALQSQKDYVKAEGEYRNDPLTKKLSGILKDIPPEQYLDNINFEPSDKYLKDADGIIQYDVKTKKPLIDPSFADRKGPIDTYDVIDKNYKKVLVPYEQKSSYTAYNNYRDQKNIQDQVYTNAVINQIDAKTKAEKEKANPVEIEQGSPPLQQGGAQTQKAADPAMGLIREKFSLIPSDSPVILPSVRLLEDTVKQYVASPGLRPQLETRLSEVKETLARSISNYTFNSVPALRDTIQEKDVAKYNDDIRASGVNELLIRQYLIDTPEDLYFTKQRDVINNYLDQVITKLKTDKQAQTDQPGRNTAAIQNTTNFLLKVKSNDPS